MHPFNRCFPPSKRRSKLVAADAGLFGASWWPNVSYERLLVATNLSLWLFAWDDEVDSAEFSTRIESLKDGRNFRQITLEWIRSSLKLCPSNDSRMEEQMSVSETPIMQLFTPVATALTEHYSTAQRETLMSQIELFVGMSEVEQRVQLYQDLPSIDEYWQRRWGTSAVLVVLSIHDFTLETGLPHSIFTHPYLKTLWDETNVIISVYVP
ncbi:MAG: hypothetical protein M1828_005278 [Chrysothrix sp. TS-e1954]|nr:MAG: hypothetical protein M1828_005278 [Chrysothrix sp. TS-e1954]